MKSLLTCLIIPLLLSGPFIAHAQVASPDFIIEKLAPGVYAAIHKPGGRAICNAGIIDLGKETLVIDPFISPYAAAELKRVISEMGLSPVRYVVNTHFHNDHIRGNQTFDDALIYSTLITRDLIAQYEPEELAHEQKVLPDRILKSDSTLASLSAEDTIQRKQVEFWNSYYKTILESHQILKTRLPDQLVSGEETLTGSSLSVKLIDMGQGHTGSDLILFIPKYKIIFTGDLLFIKNHPWIADGNPDSLKNCLKEIKAMNPNIVVPGHGPVGRQSDIDVLLKYLDHVNAKAMEFIAEKRIPDDVKDVPIPTHYENWLLSRFYTPNIKFRMEQLLATKE